MNVSQVKKGMVIKNYKEFCKLLDEPILAGNSKVAQLRKWQQYFQFTHRKQQFRIIKILEPPAEVTEGRAKRKIARRSGKVIDVFEPVLIRIVQNEGLNGELNISRYTLYERMGLISRKFIDSNYVYISYGERGIEIKNRTGNNNKFVIIGDRQIPNILDLYFYEKVNEVVRGIYRNSTISLANREVLSSESWREIMYSENEFCVANNGEMGLILDIEKETAEKMGISNPNRIFSGKARNAFYEKRCAAAKNEEGWFGVYNILKVKLLDESLLKNGKCCKKSILTLPNKRDNGSDCLYSFRLKLNSLVCDRVKERIEKEYNKFKENGVITGTIGAAIKKKAFAYEDFLDTQQFLIDNLLKI